MIIKATQIASNIKQEYDIYVDDRCFKGQLGSASKLQDIYLSGNDLLLKGDYVLSRPSDYIPFKYIFGYSKITERFKVSRNGEEYAEIKHSTNGICKGRYIITTVNGEKFECYYRTKKSFDYISVYHGERQVALVETYLNVSNYKYTHKAYLLDEYKEYWDLIAFFILYYASYNYAQRFHMSSGSSYSYGWSFSFYNKKYNPKWREENFPDENFFGKLNRFG